MVRGPGRRRLVRAVRRPRRVDQPRARRRRPRNGGRGRAARSRRRLSPDVRERAARPVRLTRRPERVPGHARRDRPPGPARARAPQRAPRTRRPDLRGHPRDAVRRTAAGCRDAGRRRASRARDRRTERLGARPPRVPPIAVRPRHVHRDERPRTRSPGADALDRWRGRVRHADLAPLPAPDARRTDRVRRFELPRHRRPRRRATLRVQRRGSLGARARLPPLVPRVRRCPAGGLLGRADRRGRAASAVLRHAAGRDHALRGRVHRKRGRPVPPRREDPLRSGARRRGRVDDPADLRRRSDALPARTPLLDRGALGQSGDRPARRPTGFGTRAGTADGSAGPPPRRLGFQLGP